MAEEKKAFVFDTNFIIENKKLNEVIETLCGDFDVYVTQVSIDERIAQLCNDEKRKYDEIDKLKQKYKGILSFKILKEQEARLTELKNAIQRNYIDLFKDNIIPFNKTSEMFSEVLKRAYDKTAPFSNADGASDKGFKDSLIWIALLSFFKSNGNNSIVFVTNDGGFIKNADILCQEFKDVTGKTIEIKPNSYYKSLLDKDDSIIHTEEIVLPNISELRTKIQEVIGTLCSGECFDEDWGYCSEKTFTLNEKVDANYVKVVLGGLKKYVSEHIFDTTVQAFDILALDDRVTNGMVSISMSDVEEVIKLHDEIQTKYPDYIEQFYNAAASVINRNYIAPPVEDDNDLPF